MVQNHVKNAVFNVDLVVGFVSFSLLFWKSTAQTTLVNFLVIKNGLLLEHITARFLDLMPSFGPIQRAAFNLGNLSGNFFSQLLKWLRISDHLMPLKRHINAEPASNIFFDGSILLKTPGRHSRLSLQHVRESRVLYSALMAKLNFSYSHLLINKNTTSFLYLSLSSMLSATPYLPGAGALRNGIMLGGFLQTHRTPARFDRRKTL